MKKLLTASGLILLTACSSVPSHYSSPKSSQLTSNPIGLDNIRVWNNVSYSEIDVGNLMSRQDYFQNLRNDDNAEFNILALSGGGANGAFGAGVLAAWSDMGTRPDFDIVTGISTGAILSVFAFLGESYDHEIIDFYTNYNDSDLYSKKGILSALKGTSLFNISLFEEMVRVTIDKDFLADIQAQHENGKRLYVGTTHMESQRLSIWNMGALASHTSDEAEKLFEDIILASTAVPGAMPGVQIDVEYKGKTYQELHVDGGVSRQVFLFPDTLSANSVRMELGDVKPNVYVIRNGEFLPRWDTVQPSTKDISSRSIETIIKYQGRSDVMRIYQQSQETNMAFHFAHLDNDFKVKQQSDQYFDDEHMRELFNYGYKKMYQDKLWQTTPPEFDSLTIDMVSTNKR